jgi:hypothetical protein
MLPPPESPGNFNPKIRVVQSNNLNHSAGLPLIQMNSGCLLYTIKINIIYICR